MRYAVVGFGTAGYHAVKEIRNYDTEGEIHVYGDTGKAPCNPMLTTYYVSGKLDRAGLYPFGPLKELEKKLDFTYHHETVKQVHGESRCVETGLGKQAYDRILIATGASAFAPAVKGLEAEDCFLMRTVEDAQRLKDRLEKTRVKYAVVVGASMAGIKVAEVLKQHGVKVCLADLAPSIFSLAAYRDVAGAIEERVRGQGVRLCFEKTIDHMEVEAGQQVAVMTDKSRIPADVVCLCIGTRANVSVVKDQVAVNRGILVNEQMETSVPGIYGAGDCCEGRNLESGQSRIIGLWANANRQGTVAGASMAGQKASFGGNILHNITHFMNMDFIGFGDNRIQGEILETGSLENGLFIRLVVKDGVVAGANILDNYRISGIVKNYMLRLFSGDKGPLPDYQRAMLVKAGLTAGFIAQVEEKINGQS